MQGLEALGLNDQKPWQCHSRKLTSLDAKYQTLKMPKLKTVRSEKASNHRKMTAAVSQAMKKTQMQKPVETKKILEKNRR